MVRTIDDATANFSAVSHIDTHQFSVYFYCMATQNQSFNRLLHAIADPTRRKILQVLKIKGACSIGKATGLCACDIEERIHLSQPTISHHMRILQKAGLVEAQKEGHWRWYQRNERAIRQFAKTLREAL
jgi:ArsR family transcriptional regulator, arsenate/arsenite/antimonite-responsive transcriptional repressor